MARVPLFYMYPCRTVRGEEGGGVQHAAAEQGQLENMARDFSDGFLIINIFDFFMQAAAVLQFFLGLAVSSLLLISLHYCVLLQVGVLLHKVENHLRTHMVHSHTAYDQTTGVGLQVFVGGGRKGTPAAKGVV